MPPTSNPADGDQVTFDPLAVLARIPADAQLLLRDYIAGLEAETGSARALAARADKGRQADAERLRLMVAGARAERDRAVAERDAALRTITELTARLQLLGDTDSTNRPGR